jgi:hypothetical protein
MNGEGVISIIRDAAEYAKNHGLELIRICDLDNLLSEIEKEIISKRNQSTTKQTIELDFAQWKAQHESSLAQYKANIDIFLEQFRSVIIAGQTALKSSILINGGAAVALLAFLGKIWNIQSSGAVFNNLPFSLLTFVFGVLSAAIASGTTYLSQYFDALKWLKLSIVTNILTIILIIISYCCFGCGAYIAYRVFITQFS